MSLDDGHRGSEDSFEPFRKLDNHWQPLFCGVSKEVRGNLQDNFLFGFLGFHSAVARLDSIKGIHVVELFLLAAVKQLQSASCRGQPTLATITWSLGQQSL